MGRMWPLSLSGWQIAHCQTRWYSSTTLDKIMKDTEAFGNHGGVFLLGACKGASIDGLWLMVILFSVYVLNLDVLQSSHTCYAINNCNAAGTSLYTVYWRKAVLHAALLSTSSWPSLLQTSWQLSAGQCLYSRYGNFEVIAACMQYPVAPGMNAVCQQQSCWGTCIAQRTLWQLSKLQRSSYQYRISGKSCHHGHLLHVVHACRTIKCWASWGLLHLSGINIRQVLISLASLN